MMLVSDCMAHAPPPYSCTNDRTVSCDACVSVVGGACDEVDWYTKVDRPRCWGSVIVYVIQGQDGCEDTSPMASPLWDTTSLEIGEVQRPYGATTVCIQLEPLGRRAIGELR